MGRWAQARKRGRKSTGFPVDAPVLGDFTVAQPGGAGLSVIVTLLIPIPAPAVYWRTYWLVNGAGGGQSHTSASTNNIGIFAPGAVLTVWIQWLDAGTLPMGYASPTKFYTCI